MPASGVSFSDHNERTEMLTERVRAHARSLGFDAVGIARADVSLDRDMERYEAFVDKEMHGEMGYLARNRAARTCPAISTHEFEECSHEDNRQRCGGE